NTSTRLDGADGPLGRVEACRVKLIGEEEVEIPAGRFKATHFQVDSDNLEVPASSLWVAGEDKILLRCDWRELDLEYVLTAWKVEQFLSVIFLFVIFLSVIFLSVIFLSVIFLSVIFLSVIFLSVIFLSVIFLSVIFLSVIFLSVIFLSVI